MRTRPFTFGIAVCSACSFFTTVVYAQQSPNACLIEAVKKGNLPAARRAVLAGADVNAREARLTHPRLETRDKGGRPYAGDTALILAIEARDPRMVTLLIGKGADVNRQGLRGRTPLCAAVENNRTDFVKFLVRRGADVNLHLKGGPSPLDYALTHGYGDVMARTLRALGGRTSTGGKVDATGQNSSDAFRLQVTVLPFDVAWTAEDQQVIEAAAKYLLHHYSRVLWWEKEVEEVAIVDRTAGGNDIYDEQIDSELTDQQANEVTLGMREHLTARNNRIVSLAGMKLKSAHIYLQPPNDGAQLSGANPRRGKERIWMRVWLPGYSPRHDRAVLHFGAGGHGTGARLTYFLLKRHGQWQVKWGGFWYND